MSVYVIGASSNGKDESILGSYVSKESVMFGLLENLKKVMEGSHDHLYVRKVVIPSTTTDKIPRNIQNGMDSASLPLFQSMPLVNDLRGTPQNPYPYPVKDTPPTVQNLPIHQVHSLQQQSFDTTFPVFGGNQTQGPQHLMQPNVDTTQFAPFMYQMPGMSAEKYTPEQLTSILTPIQTKVHSKTQVEDNLKQYINERNQA